MLKKKKKNTKEVYCIFITNNNVFMSHYSACLCPEQYFMTLIIFSTRPSLCIYRIEKWSIFKTQYIATAIDIGRYIYIGVDIGIDICGNMLM